jgi:transposase
MAKKKRIRRIFTAEQKAVILRRHIADKVAVSDLCDEYKLQPSLFYRWQHQAMENLVGAVEPANGRRQAAREAELEKRITQLEARLVRKDSVIAEVSEEFVKLKKELGEL